MSISTKRKKIILPPRILIKILREVGIVDENKMDEINFKRKNPSRQKREKIVMRENNICIVEREIDLKDNYRESNLSS